MSSLFVGLTSKGQFCVTYTFLNIKLKCVKLKKNHTHTNSYVCVTEKKIISEKNKSTNHIHYQLMDKNGGRPFIGTSGLGIFKSGNWGMTLVGIGIRKFWFCEGGIGHFLVREIGMGNFSVRNSGIWPPPATPSKNGRPFPEFSIQPDEAQNC